MYMYHRTIIFICIEIWNVHLGQPNLNKFGIGCYTDVATTVVQSYKEVINHRLVKIKSLGSQMVRDVHDFILIGYLQNTDHVVRIGSSTRKMRTY